MTIYTQTARFALLAAVIGVFFGGTAAWAGFCDKAPTAPVCAPPSPANSEYMAYSKVNIACGKRAENAGHPLTHFGFAAQDNKFWEIEYPCERERGYTCAKLADMATRIPDNMHSVAEACAYFERFHDFTNYVGPPAPR